ncbi:membrane-spanning 4-domains subfamily A member 15 [Polyodon spathula]|uniref:membrane-spanning 4-domains subfamily A member 15 n=1 Tax=Polyodon spathula TaxID=7913 RepID=UPI001B7EABF5|nr:membrane-spanning 4-domains subfamily A member 15 [Polyodon spathula]
MSTAEPSVCILPAVPETCPPEGAATVQSCSETMLAGGVKPLHRFIRGEPKSVGIAVLFLGLTVMIIGFEDWKVFETDSFSLQPFLIGLLFIISGILCIVSENRPTKQLVTACLAVNIISILVSPFAVMQQMVQATSKIQLFPHDFNITALSNCTDPCWPEQFHHTLLTTFWVSIIYILSGMVLLIVMSGFACAGLRPSQSQAIVVMNMKPTDEN